MTTQDLKKALAFLKAGKVVVFPTDTVYGLLADATSKKAVERTFVIKRRQKTKPLPLFVDTIRMAKQVAAISKPQERFLRSRWPGAFTAVLKRKKSSPILYGIDAGTVALRIPNLSQLRSLVRLLGKPIIATSANLSGKNPCSTIREVRKQLGARPDLFVDGGTLHSRPSRILDMTTKPYRTLR
ncbi:MAG: L-threonylcarbamoyladenylate synthase [bacterium]|nr:L-threonylcarbamoyladenylate synthase [bacterium]